MFEESITLPPFWAQTWEFWERYSFVFGMLPGVGPPRRVIPTGQSFLFLNSMTRVVWLSQHGLNFHFSFWMPLAVFQFSSAHLCLTPCNPMDCSTPGFLVHHQLLQPTQTQVHCVGDAIQPSHPLLSPSPPAVGWHRTRLWEGGCLCLLMDWKWPESNGIYPRCAKGKAFCFLFVSLFCLFQSKSNLEVVIGKIKTTSCLDPTGLGLLREQLCHHKHWGAHESVA